MITSLMRRAGAVTLLLIAALPACKGGGLTDKEIIAEVTQGTGDALVGGYSLGLTWDDAKKLHPDHVAKESPNNGRPIYQLTHAKGGPGRDLRLHYQFNTGKDGKIHWLGATVNGDSDRRQEVKAIAQELKAHVTNRLGGEGNCHSSGAAGSYRCDWEKGKIAAYLKYRESKTSNRSELFIYTKGKGPEAQD